MEMGCTDNKDSVCLFAGRSKQRHSSTRKKKARVVGNLCGIVFTVSEQRTMYLGALWFFLPLLMLRVIKVRVRALDARSRFFLLTQVCECLSVVLFQYV